MVPSIDPDQDKRKKPEVTQAWESNPPEPRELRPVSFLGDDDEDSIFDFRPTPVDVREPDPKAWSAAGSADSFMAAEDLIPKLEEDLPISQPELPSPSPISAVPVSVGKGSTAARETGSS